MLNQNKKITIGITAYKDSDYLEMAINSVLNQTSSDWNGTLVLDGGSDQKTKKIFDDFEHPKFQKYKLLENKGPYGARAKAIELSDTEWYYQLDGDDSLPSNAISDVISAIDNNPIVCILTVKNHLLKNHQIILKIYAILYSLMVNHQSKSVFLKK